MKYSTIKYFVMGLLFIVCFCGCNHDNGSDIDIPISVHVGDESAAVSGEVNVEKNIVSADVIISAIDVEIRNNEAQTDNNDVNQTEIITTVDDIIKENYVTKPFAINAVDENQYDLSTSLIGVWSGDYVTGDNIVKLNLIIYNYEGNAIDAIFSFNNAFENGSYFMTGNILNEDEIKLTGEQWIDRPKGYTFLDINGIISYDDMTIVDDSTSLNIRKTSQDIISIPPKKEISNEGYLSSLSPYRTDGINDYMVNNSYHTHTGDVYPNGFVATSAGVSPEHVISVCSYSPFELTYNLEKKYTYIGGKVGFDDITVSNTDLFGIGSLFQGVATITFSSNDKELYSLELSTSDIPKEFGFSVSGIDQLKINVDFPYNNFVIDNFNKFFNFIDVKIE